MASDASYRLPRTVVPTRYALELTPDLPEARFTGSLQVDLRVDERAEEIVCNAADLELGDVRLQLPDGTRLDGRADLDPELQRARLRFGRPIEAGTGYRLELEFSGILNDKLHGFYRSTFRDDAGTEHLIAVTQFEPADARRAFPCWDEPDFKATFAVTLVVDERLSAISNGAPVADDPAPAAPDGTARRRIRFAETMPMSTYLVAFVVGPFELTDAVDVDGVPLRVAAPPARAALTRYAIEAGVHALRFLAGYFELPYPSDKIDHVAIPDFAFGAMENLGCVTYRETALLVDPAAASQLELQRVATVIAHETAHMWFGDLVTMRWWNGIWLNEAFATFMELTTTDAFRPDWQVWTAFGADRSAAMGIDGLRNTRPIEFAVGPPEEAEGMFDVLTYEKGGAVLRMLEQYLGPDTFRRGIAHYLRLHRHANTETTDLWDALEAVSGEPVRATMDSWIFQGGHPVVTVGAGSRPGSVTLRQARFLYAGDDPEPRWAVPVNLRASVGGTVARRRLLLDSQETTVELGEGALEWVVVNDGGWGFYRVAYEPELLAGLLAAGMTTTCSPLERLNLVSDTWAAVVAGRAPLSAWVRLAAGLSGTEDDPDVWAALLAPLGLLELAADDGELPDLQAFTRRLAGPALARLGAQRPDEAERRRILRSRLTAALGTTGADEAVRRDAAKRFAAYLDDPSTLVPDLVATTLNVVVSAGGAGEWEQVLGLYRSAATPQEKMRCLSALGRSDDPALLARGLDLALSPDVRTQDAPFFIGAILAGRAGRAVAWDWLVARWEEVLERLPGNTVIRMLEGISAVCDPTAAAGVHRWLADHPIPTAGPRLAQLEERMDVNVAFAGRVSGTLAAALRAAGS